jgi:hypothetical protein
MSLPSQIIPANTAAQCAGAEDKDIGSLKDGLCNPYLCLCKKGFNYQRALQLHEAAGNVAGSDSKAGKKKGLTPGDVAGITIGIVVAAVVVCVIVWAVLKKKKENSE